MTARPLTLFFAAATIAGASGTATWEMSGHQEFLKGRFQGVSLKDGRLQLAPKLEMLFSSDQPMVWSLAQGPGGVIYAGTGHQGRVIRIDAAGKSEVLWTAAQPEVFAVAVDASGAVYAATSPDGAVFRVVNGKAEEYFAPHTKYIWSLAFDAAGALYAGTGEQGRIFRITARGNGEVYYETGQAHVTSLAFDAQGRLLAGSEPNGILYRITAKDKAFVLYDAALPEIRAVAPMPDGTIYAAALGGSLARKGAAASQGAAGQAAPQVTAPTISVTVTGDGAQAGSEIKPPADPSKPQQPAAAPAPTVQAAPAIEYAGVEKSALYRINPDNTVETLWTSKEENVYDLLPRGADLFFSTDSGGRVYELSSSRKLTLVAQTNEGEAIRLLGLAGGGLLAATGDMGRVYRLSAGAGAEGAYESPVHDVGTVARWGRISWRASLPTGARLSLQTRSGNSLRPDPTWSDWSGPLAEAAGSAIPSPNARYIQWKADLSGAATPEIDTVTVAYLPQNTAPVVKSITVTPQWVAPPAKPAPPAAAANAISMTVTDTPDAAVTQTSAGSPTQPLARAANQVLNIAWQAEDAEGDRLVYALHFRGDGERDWKLLKSGIHETTFQLDGDVLADGRYLFRVTASDREANAPAAAREGELAGGAVLIDNTPPVITAGEVRRAGAALELDFEASDATSPLRRAEYSLDAGPWIPLEAADGVIDSHHETFRLRMPDVAPGEHVLVLRAVDSGNNAGLRKFVIR
jgi:sugar lactone lactonase YvrE